MSKVLGAYSSRFHVTVTENNRIKLWKIESINHFNNVLANLLHEFSEPNHLKITYTCLNMFDLYDQINSNNINSNNSQSFECIIALGDMDGRIVLFNVNNGEKFLELSYGSNNNNGHNGNINCLQFHYKNNNNDITDTDNNFNDLLSKLELFSCGNDKKFCRWNLSGELLSSFTVNENSAPTCFTLTNRYITHVITGSNNIIVWDIPTQKPINYFVGHASQVRHMKLTMDNNYLISAGQDRFLYIWKVKSLWKYNKKVQKGKNNKNSKDFGTIDSPQLALHTLSLDDIVLSLDIRSTLINIEKVIDNNEASATNEKNNKKDKTSNSDKYSYTIAAASTTSVYIWNFDPNNKKSTLNLKPLCKIRIPLKMQSKLASNVLLFSSINCVNFIDNKNVRIYRGNGGALVYKKVRILDDHEKWIHSVDLGSVTLSDFAQRVDRLNRNLIQPRNDANLIVLDVADAQIPSIQMNEGIVADLIGENNKKKNENDQSINKQKKDSNITMSKKRKLNDEKDENKKDFNTLEVLTFSQKLAQIENELQKKQNENGVPTADSLASLLTQSLIANDQRMFEDLLLVQHEEVKEYESDLIKNTLDRIDSKCAIVLLERLTQKFRSHPRQVISLLRWMVPLLNRHSSTFSEDLSTRQILISIHQTIDYHVKTLLPALKLQGRLSLLCGQENKIQQFNNNYGNNNVNNKYKIDPNKPLFTYDDRLEELQPIRKNPKFKTNDKKNKNIKNYSNENDEEKEDNNDNGDDDNNDDNDHENNDNVNVDNEIDLDHEEYNDINLNEEDEDNNFIESMKDYDKNIEKEEEDDED